MRFKKYWKRKNQIQKNCYKCKINYENWMHLIVSIAWIFWTILWVNFCKIYWTIWVFTLSKVWLRKKESGELMIVFHWVESINNFIKLLVNSNGKKLNKWLISCHQWCLIILVTLKYYGKIFMRIIWTLSTKGL